jgi:hypothetical protein
MDKVGFENEFPIISNIEKFGLANSKLVEHTAKALNIVFRKMEDKSEYHIGIFAQFNEEFLEKNGAYTEWATCIDTRNKITETELLAILCKVAFARDAY